MNQNKWVILMTALMTILTLTPVAWANTAQVGTLTAVEGNVEILENPTASVSENEKDGPRVLYEKKYYRYRLGRAGETLKDGSVVRTAFGAKARVIYDNGDQIQIGPATYYKITWSEGRPTLDMKHGKVRAIVSKKGPRNLFRIRTRSATMGVRGTDFAVTSAGDDVTRVSVIRGAVEVKDNAGKQTQPIKLASGKTTFVGHPKMPKAEILPTSKKELADIQQSFKVASSGVSGTEAAQVEALEKKSVEAVMDEIKSTDPKLYEELKKESIADPAELDGKLITTIQAQAPDTIYDIDLEKNRKAQEEQYKKFFK